MKEHVLEGQTLDWLLASASEAMLIVNPDGRIVLANPPIERLFGYAPAELIGQPLELLLPERVRVSHVRMREQFFSNPRARPMGAGVELHARRRNGDEFPVEIGLSPLRTDRGLSLVLATIHDITHSKLAEEALRQSQDALRSLAAHQETIKENERKRIAQEIHDELGSLLTGIKAHVSVSIERAVQAGQTPDALLVDATRLADDAIAAVRRVITDLRPSVLDQLGVWEALAWYANQIELRADFVCECTIDDDAFAVELDPDRSTMLFRIVQETLTNVQRHAEASHVSIHVRRDGRGLVLEVRDDGKGIGLQDDPARQSWGILGMRERARHFGGELTITGEAGAGTTVVLHLPLEDRTGGS
jgi:two-component system sensor histidine kinase UhpB